MPCNPRQGCAHHIHSRSCHGRSEPIPSPPGALQPSHSFSSWGCKPTFHTVRKVFICTASSTGGEQIPPWMMAVRTQCTEAVVHAQQGPGPLLLGHMPGAPAVFGIRRPSPPVGAGCLTSRYSLPQQKSVMTTAEEIKQRKEGRREKHSHSLSNGNT